MTTNEVCLIDALELMVFCNHQGQLDMKSDFETRLYQDLTDQILAKVKDSKELCFIWMFLRSRGPSERDTNSFSNFFLPERSVFRLENEFYPYKPVMILTNE